LTTSLSTINRNIST